MKYNFLTLLFIAGIAITACSSTKNSKNATDSTAINRSDSVGIDTTKKQPDTTKHQ